MYGEHPDAQFGRGANRPRHRVRDVVKFEIEEHPVTAFGQTSDDRWALPGKEEAPDLEPAGHIPELLAQFERSLRCVDVECN